MILESTARKTVSLGTQEFALNDQTMPAFFTDCLTEFRQANGSIALAFGSIRADGNDIPVVNVVSRLRMNIVTAQVVRDILSNLIDEATKPADTSKAN